jgi:hypothetical protein
VGRGDRVEHCLAVEAVERHGLSAELAELLEFVLRTRRADDNVACRHQQRDETSSYGS